VAQLQSANVVSLLDNASLMHDGVVERWARVVMVGARKPRVSSHLLFPDLSVENFASEEQKIAMISLRVPPHYPSGLRDDCTVFRNWKVIKRFLIPLSGLDTLVAPIRAINYE